MLGGIDLNNPPVDEADVMLPETGVEDMETDAGPDHMEEVTEPGATIDSKQTGTGGGTTDTGAPTGHTLSSEDSGSDGEVQSTPEGFAPQKPYVGIKFDTWEAAKVHYNRYAKHIGFSMKMSSSRKSVRDKQLDKYLFVCNKSGKNTEREEVPPVKMRNQTITIRTECLAKMRVKRTGAYWEVTQFVEEHTHALIKKFGLKKFLRSHKKIPKEERDSIDLLDSVNLSAGRIMDIMAELYGNAKVVPYDSKAISN